MKNNPYKILTLSLLATLLGVLSSSSLHATAASSISVTYAGTYSPGLSYAQGNVVKYGNCTYIALGAIATNASPSARPSAWTVFGVLPENNYFGSGSNTFSLDFVTVGNPGNTNDTTGYGKVDYTYQMGTYDISQNQINVAKSNGLAGMPLGSWLGDQPATSINWYQAAAFVNWLNTNEGYTPAYNLTYSNGSYSMALWPTNQAWTNGGTNLYRNANCVYFLPSENEWYKAAYYDPNKNNGTGGYWQYSDGMNTLPTAVASSKKAGTAVYFNGVSLFSPATVTQAGGFSPYGTMGQGGNVNQWIEGALSGSNTDPSFNRVVRGGCWGFGSNALLSSYRNNNGDYGNGSPAIQNNSLGFRVARILP
jgi:formylglycine-generating enzyme required for sulfatase activity